ncbi:hypothetical protein SAE02_05470 [Skermanella aerolata]|jgi:hypothetical protein|uniref:Autotransporter domain-containing protein n=1 Tax=Skermanella aerolata TaxID=393310 RepID=A0A512DIU3_9PROT|nr:hypothetical protein N826_01135 [Skermanella aerolata KACC 11604]GEO36399.1 hypothetical protein SAE02_05470 [Skermanella aerolata]
MTMNAALPIAVVATILLCNAPAIAQVTGPQLRDIIKSAAVTSDLASAFQALTIFGATPGISTARLHVDEAGPDGRFSSYKLAPSYAFASEVPGIRPYVEMTVGYLNNTQSSSLAVNAPVQTAIDLDIDTFTALGGGGLEIDIAEGTVLRPILLAGYSRTSGGGVTNGPEGDLIREAGSGIFFDVVSNNFLIGGALALDHARTLGEDANLKLSLRYNQLLDRSFDASADELEGINSYGVLTGSARIDGPLPVTLAGRSLRWIGFASNTFLPGSKRDLGFSFFFELGGGVEIVDPSIVEGVEGISLRTSAIAGDGVYGWSIGLAMEF